MSENDSTEASLLATNLYFKQIFDLVPPKAFFDAESKKKIAKHKNICAENGTQEGKNNKQKRKKAKLDPSQATTTTDLQQLLPDLDHLNSDAEGDGMEKENSEEIPNGVVKNFSKLLLKSSTAPSKTSKNKFSPPTSNSKALEEGSDEHGSSKPTQDMEHMNGSGGEDYSSGSSAIPSPGHIAEKPRLNPEQLREKLRGRIKELQSKRQHGMTAEEFMESKKLRRKESKLKLKQKRKEAKKLKLSVEKQAKNNQNKVNGVPDIKPQTEANNINNSSKMVFSKFEFSDQAKKPKDRKQKKPKSYKELYDKVSGHSSCYTVCC